jgi:hypothetical protein
MLEPIITTSETRDRARIALEIERGVLSLNMIALT